MINHHLSFIVFVLGAFILCLLMLLSGFVLGGKTKLRLKQVPFESGILPTGNARLRFSIQFYLVAMFFVIFDIETIYLFAWSTVVRESGWMGFIEAMIFIIILLISLMYLISVGSLNWISKKSKYYIQKNNCQNLLNFKKM